MENPNPVLYQVDQKDFYHFSYDPTTPLSSDHIFSTFHVSILQQAYSLDWIRRINDPEHPMSLEQLGVVQREHIEVNEADKSIIVKFTPTIPHCSMATLIGLCIQIKLQKELPPSFYINVKIREGSHVSEEGINKQLADKERVSAALENPNLLGVVNLCLDGPPQPGIIHAANH